MTNEEKETWNKQMRAKNWMNGWMHSAGYQDAPHWGVEDDDFLAGWKAGKAARLAAADSCSDLYGLPRGVQEAAGPFPMQL